MHHAPPVWLAAVSITARCGVPVHLNKPGEWLYNIMTYDIPSRCSYETETGQ